MSIESKFMRNNLAMSLWGKSFLVMVLLFFCGWANGQDRYGNTPVGLPYEADPLYQRHHSLRAVEWDLTERHGDLAYFIFSEPNRLRRYNLATQTWLADITLAQAATAIAVDDDGLYIAFGANISRFNLDGTNETSLANIFLQVTAIFTGDNFLYLNNSEDFVTLEKQTGNVIQVEDFFTGMQGFSFAADTGKVFGRSVSVFPGDIFAITVGEDGLLEFQSDSPYHLDYPSAEKTWVFPDETRVADNSGIVYFTSDLTYANSLAGGFDHLEFNGNQPVVLRDQTFFAYSQNFLELGRFSVPYDPSMFYIQGDTLHTFYTEAGILQAGSFPLVNMVPLEPGPAVDPAGLAYTPDKALMDETGIIYLLSRTHKSIFRWTTTEERYLETIPLALTPDYMAYSATNRELYLTYPGGSINKIAVNGPMTERPFVNSSQTALNIATAGPFIFVCDPSIATSHYTFHPDGSMISQEMFRRYSREFIWSEALGKMYHFRDGTSPNDLLWEDIDVDGVIGLQRDSPAHGGIATLLPIRLVLQDTRVILGSGTLFDPITLNVVDTLPNQIEGAGTLDQMLVTTRTVAGDTEVQVWESNLAFDRDFLIQGEHVALLESPTYLTTVTQMGGVPQFLNILPCMIRDINATSLGVPEWPALTVVDLIRTLNQCMP